MQAGADGAQLGPRMRSTVVWGSLGLIAGAVVGAGPWGALSGLAIGVLAGSQRAASQRIAELEAALRGLEARTAARREPEPGLAPPAAEAEPRPTAMPATPAELPDAAPVPSAPALPAAAAPAPGPPMSPTERARLRGPSQLARTLRPLLLGGNTVVRVGVLVLLIGVSLLARWAVDNELFPIEARLAVSALIGLALTTVGYRLRAARPGFGTTLQGGGIAALYLVVFFAYRIFELVPASLAFALFAVIAIACAVLALVQHSQPLIFIGSVGGFAAPVLASTGEGNHVALFSYYLLLNVGIAAVAWLRAWRALNLLAFVATYGVATAWGVLRYKPEHFATSEPFLLAYMVLFTGIALAFAWRSPPRLAGWVDGTLVFGTPLVTLLAQARLVEDIELGMAYSTAGFALAYALLATWVWRRAPATLRRAAEAFAALAVVFGTIAIPLGLDDGLTTTLVWSLEGAGLYWVGTRQGRRLPRYSGIGLQLLAAAAFCWAAVFSGFETRRVDFLVLINARFLSCAALAAAGLFIAREAWAMRSALDAREWQGTQALAAWALAWWAGGALAEIDQFLDPDYRVTAALVALAASGIALERGAARLGWLPGRLFALATLPAGFLALVASLDSREQLLAHGGLLAWPLLLASIQAILGRLESEAAAWARLAQAPWLWLLGLVAAFGLHGVAEISLALGGDWPAAGFGVGLAGVLLAADLAAERGVGAFGRHASTLRSLGCGPIAALAVLSMLALNVRAQGASAPLPYLPLLNPTDAALGLLALALLQWWQRLRQAQPAAIPRDLRMLAATAGAALAFVWLNGLLVRSVHQWTGVAFEAEALWQSGALQVALSISWTLVALAGMWLATWRSHRPGWIAAATLLGVVVVKLFVVDLSTLSTGEKIGTFLAVGVLLLVVGYLSPVPPSRPEEQEGTTA
jgi:uncharacterized membrane protein